MNTGYALAVLCILAAVTALLRFLPFTLFGSGKKIPEAVLRLGRRLPYASMGMLVIYCLKDISVTTAPHGLPELISCAVTALVHILKRSTVLSIAAGTAAYMLLIRFVF